MTHQRKRAGDTLIEVLLAITIFSAGAVAAVVIMNRGITNAQRSLEITLVRNQINNQAELLRHLNNVALVSSGRLFSADDADGGNPDAVQNEWLRIEGFRRTSAKPYDDLQTIADCSPDQIDTNRAFFINPETGKIQPIVTGGTGNFQKRSPFAKVSDDTSDMIWIYAVKRSSGEGRDPLGNSDFYDFHIRACWDAPDGANVQKLGTIVRLYEPK